MVGQTVGHYRVLEKLGEGGMGVVYLAEDSALKRKVALKVLPEQFTHDRERLARFQREAQLLASLSDPHIAAIYGLEELDSQQILVLELAEGETLDQKISRGPLPVDDALEIALQIAEGLEAAHEKGIIHRDLKPANVMVSSEGKVKILDFGLAKAFEGEVTGADIADSPTITYEMTRPGVILGTAAYMSPEQARGKTVDKRTDIWAFGCVLYEMLTGKKAFAGEAITDVLAKILEREPDWELLPGNLHWRIRELLTRCLRKDPRERLRDTGDAKLELVESSQKLPEGFQGTVPVRFSWRRTIPVLVAAIIIASAATALISRWILEPVSFEKPVTRLTIDLPKPMPFVGSAPLGYGRPALALSRDGVHLAYAADIGGDTQLYLRRLDEFDASPIPGTNGAYNPFFSTNSQWIGFFAQDQLKKVAISGGEPIPLCDVSNAVGACWGPGDNIIFSQHEGYSLHIISAAGGTSEVLKAGMETGYNLPELLPGEKVVLAGAGTYYWPDLYIKAFFLDSSDETILAERAENPKYLPTGHLLYTFDGRLYAVPFDVDTLELGSSAVVVLDDVRTEQYFAQYAVSENGTLVYAVGGHVSKGRLVWLDLSGEIEELPFPAQSYGTYQISPKGNRLAVSVFSGGNWDIWIYDLVRELATKLTLEGNNYGPVWTSDGGSVAFSSNRAEAYNLYLKSADGSGDARRLTHSEVTQMLSSISEDGEFLVVDEGQGGINDISLLSTRSPNKSESLLGTRFDEWGAVFSPDGDYFAYTSTVQGPYEVWVQPYPPESGKKWRISSEGGEEPHWSPSLNELYYRAGEKWMVVEYETEPEFAPEAPKLLFEGSYLNVPGISYDVSRDGERFLLIRPVEEATSVSQLNVVLNWFEELKRLCPTDN